MNPGISVVVPVYNSRGTLAALVDALLGVFATLDSVIEILLIDDASSDASWESICDLVKAHSEVRGLRLARNFGEQNAVLCGVMHARHPVIVTIDDDLQQPPTVIPQMLERLSDEVDLVYGVAAHDRHSVFRRLTARPTKWTLERCLRVPGAAGVSSLRVFRTRLREEFPPIPGPLCSVDGLLRSSTSRIVQVEVEHRARPVGQSQYTPMKLLTHTTSAVVGGSSSPLAFAVLTGVLSMVVALVGVVWSLISHLAGSENATWWALFGFGVIGLLGVALVALGLLGEYAVRIFHRAGAAPSYVIAESACQD